MSDDKLISIIVPIYNIENYLDKCISSILQQSYNNLEVILVNDGSTDSSLSICEKYAAIDKRIKIINKQNGGVSSARKAGVDASTGDYIMCVDGDDWIESKMCRDLLMLLEANNVDFVDSGYIYDPLFGASKSVILESNLVNLEKDRTHIMETWFLGQRKFLQPIIGKLYRASLFKQISKMIPDDAYIGEDFQCFMFLLANAHTAVTTREVYYHYVQRNGSYCNRISYFLIVETCRVMSNFRKEIEHNFPKINIQIVDFWITKICYEKTKLIVSNRFPDRYYLKNPNEFFKKNIVVYGAGIVGQCYIGQLSRYESISIVRWIDKNYSNFSFDYRSVNDVKSILSVNFDVVLIAVKNEITALEIKSELSDLGIPDCKIVWKEPAMTIDISNDNIL